MTLNYISHQDQIKLLKVSKLTECGKNVKDWMTNNFLLLKSDNRDITYWT